MSEAPKSEASLSATLSDQIADLAETSVRSVVNIDARSISIPRDLSDEAMALMLATPYRTLKQLGLLEKLEQNGIGSGVIVHSDGYILTNSHVVPKGCEVTVTMNDERVLSGRIVARDKNSDLALVKVDTQDLPAAPLGKPEAVRLGQMVVAIGSPGGFVFTVTKGIISALRRRKVLPHVDLLQTDAAISLGSSGGPLFNMHGELIGINTAVWADAQNIGLAVPLDRIERFLRDNLSRD